MEEAQHYQKFITQPVLIHPQLADDPAQKKNTIGTIISIDRENDQGVIRFEAGDQAPFPLDALLVLRDPVKIKRDADNDATLMPFWDYSDIMEILDLAESILTDYRKFAIQLSQKNPNAMEYTMDTLRHELELERTYMISH